MTLADIINQKIAIACSTEEEAFWLKEHVCSYYPDASSYPFVGNFNRIKDEYYSQIAAFEFHKYDDDGTITCQYCDTEWYKNEGYEIIPLAEFIEEKTPTIEIGFDAL